MTPAPPSSSSALRRRQIGNDTANLHIGIDGRNAPRGRRSFGKRLRGVVLLEQPLTMQIAGLDVIAVDDR